MRKISKGEQTIHSQEVELAVSEQKTGDVGKGFPERKQNREFGAIRGAGEHIKDPVRDGSVVHRMIHHDNYRSWAKEVSVYGLSAVLGRRNMRGREREGDGQQHSDNAEPQYSIHPDDDPVHCVHSAYTEVEQRGGRGDEDD